MDLDFEKALALDEDNIDTIPKMRYYFQHPTMPSGPWYEEMQ